MKTAATTDRWNCADGCVGTTTTPATRGVLNEIHQRATKKMEIEKHTQHERVLSCSEEEARYLSASCCIDEIRVEAKWVNLSKAKVRHVRLWV